MGESQLIPPFFPYKSEISYKSGQQRKSDETMNKPIFQYLASGTGSLFQWTGH